MRTIAQHPSDEELVALIDHELAPAVRSQLASHLEACTSCAARSAAMEATLGRVGADLLSELDPETDLRKQRARLLRALREPAAVIPMPPQARSVAPSLLIQCAAVAVVCFGIWLVASSRVGERSSATEMIALRSEGGVTRPLPTVTPGAVSIHTAAELCAGARPSRLVTFETRRQVLRRYRMEQVSADEYELDALITPELGGTTDAANLWPQRYDSPVWNARVKDDLERLLPEMVCRGELDLAVAQQAIASDWVAAYKTFFRTDTPLASRGTPDADDDLVLLPVSYRQ